jgi:hypothetical protein
MKIKSIVVVWSLSLLLIVLPAYSADQRPDRSREVVSAYEECYELIKKNRTPEESIRLKALIDSHEELEFYAQLNDQDRIAKTLIAVSTWEEDAEATTMLFNLSSRIRNMPPAIGQPSRLELAGCGYALVLGNLQAQRDRQEEWLAAYGRDVVEERFRLLEAEKAARLKRLRLRKEQQRIPESK